MRGTHYRSLWGVCSTLVMCLTLLVTWDAASPSSLISTLVMTNATFDLYTRGHRAEGVHAGARISGEQVGEELWSATQVAVPPRDRQLSPACYPSLPLSQSYSTGICSQLLDLARRPASSEMSTKPQGRPDQKGRPEDMLKDMLEGM
jgi:hypothetical protein